MIRNYKQGAWETQVDFTVEFDLDDYGGFSFPCDANGTPVLNPEARENYEYCMKHPEKFQAWNVVRKHKWSWKNPATGDCICGEHIELIDEYEGACECPKCGRWYNLFGQELIHPKYWEEDTSEEEPW